MGPHQIIDHPRRRRANLIVEEPSSLANPTSYEQVRQRANAAEWIAAEDSELHDITRHGVWEIAKKEPHEKCLDTIYVYRTKRDANGVSVKKKARLCVLGNRQVEGINYNETFAPTGCDASLRLLLMIAASENFELDQMDVRCAFLNGLTDMRIFIRPPKGVKIDLKPNQGLLLKKSLYGLKQSPRCWYKALSSFFSGINFLPSHSDPCLFISADPSNPVLIFVHVDDLVITGQDIKPVKEALKSKFEMHNLGPCEWVLGMRVSRNREGQTITLQQDQYIHNMLEEFGMLDCCSVTSPLPSNYLHDPMPSLPPSSDFNYCRGVCLLGYLVQKSRPDLAHPHSFLSQFLNAPSAHLQSCFYHVLRYLHFSSKHGLTLGHDSRKALTLRGYADADYSSSSDRQSFSGSVVALNGLLGWQCTKQQVVTLSTTEAEHHACTETAQDLLWCKQLIDQIFAAFSLPIPPCSLLCNNKGAIDLILNPLYQHRTQHIDVRLHFLRQHIHKNDFGLSYVATTNNPADSLTKLVSPKLVRQANKRFQLMP